MRSISAPGTGRAAFLLAQRYPEAEVVGVDLAEDMLAEARKLTPPELADRVRFERRGRGAAPYPDGSFDLVSLANMIPFFEELGRVTAPAGRWCSRSRRAGDADLRAAGGAARAARASKVSRNLRTSRSATGQR